MSEVAFYSLELLIDGTQVSLDDLKKRVARVLDRHGLSVDWQLTQTTSQHLKLSIRGSLEDVDACHLRLNDEFVGDYSCIRLHDEAGGEIRQRAYPILAHIEQQLRAFINCAMIQVRGFDWWDSITPFLTEQGIRDGVQKVEERIGKASAVHHPLELALFDHLIPIVTSSIQYWSTSKPLSADDLLEILSDCSSLEELQEKLVQKTREISLWDEVFARYFDDEDKWKELAGILTDFVIPVRNKVMHHRPMHVWELRELRETEQVVDTLLASAVAELSEEERAEARQVSEEWSRALARVLAEAVRPAITVQDIMGPFLKQQEELSRMFAEAVRPAITIQDIMGPFLKQQEELSRMFRERILGDTAQRLAAPNTAYVGSSDSLRFHLLTCRYARRILPENRIQFTDRDEAVAKGYLPCRVCKP
jgi:hypothetical protein